MSLLVAFSLLLSQSCNEKRRKPEAQKDNKAQELSEKLQQDTYKDQKAKGVSETLQEWNMIGNFGIVRTLYVSPEGLKDKFYVAQVLLSVMRKEKIVANSDNDFRQPAINTKGFPDD